MGKRLIIAAIVIALGAGVSYFRGNLILRAAQSLGFVDRPVAARNTLAKARELAKPTPAQEAASRLAEPEKAANAKTTPGSAAKPATQSAPAKAAAPAANAKPAAGATAAKATTPAKATAPANAAGTTAVAAKPAPGVTQTTGVAPPASGGVKPGSVATAAKPAAQRTPATAIAKAPAPSATGRVAAARPGTGATRSPAGGSAKGGTIMAASAFAAEPFLDPTDKLSGWVREPYHYQRLGRRDPFGSLLSGDFVADGEPGLVDVGDMKLVGIAWDQADRFAMVEDSRGFGYALRQGDPIRSGRVLRIDRTSVTFVQSMAGESNTVTIELPSQEGK